MRCGAYPVCPTMAREHDHSDDQPMSFGDHLDELRRRIFFGLAPLLPLAIVFFFLSGAIVSWLASPLLWALRDQDLPASLQALGPAETLGTQLKLSIIAALIVSGPWLLWQGWQFIRPGLYAHERRFVHLLIPGSAVLTACGVLLMQYAMLPLMLWVLINIGASLNIGGTPPEPPPAVQAILDQAETVELRLADPAEPEPGQVWMTWRRSDRISIAYEDADGAPALYILPRTASMITQEYRLSYYISFVLLLHLAIVIAFQMPLVILLLGWIGIASADWLKSRRKYALLICAVVSAVITPADVVSQIIMLVPLYGLYELGILLLVIAPASRVAEGRVFNLRQSDKSVARTEESDQSAQTDADTPGRGRPPHDDNDDADNSGGTQR